MATPTYQQKREQLLTYFDKTAAAAWARLTSEVPLGRIRQSVRAGREQMRNTLMQWLPEDMHGMSLLDAGCGTGALSVAAARRGARVIAVDLSPTLIELAHERSPADLGDGSIEFHSGDMLAMDFGQLDYAVAMDSLIHYRAADAVDTLAALADRTASAVLFTFAPGTPLLRLMHSLGRLFPKANMAPAIDPTAESELRRRLAGHPGLGDWQAARSARISSGFYTSQAMELVPV